MCNPIKDQQGKKAGDCGNDEWAPMNWAIVDFRLASSERAASSTLDMWRFRSFAVASAVYRIREDLQMEGKAFFLKVFANWLRTLNGLRTVRFQISREA